MDCKACGNTGFLILDDKAAIYCDECYSSKLLTNRFNLANIDAKWREAALPLSAEAAVRGFLSHAGEHREEVDSLDVMVAEFRDNIDQYGGLYFYGNTGRGKTYCAYIILGAALRAGKKVFAIKEERVLEHAFGAPRNDNEEFDRWEWEHRSIYEADLLLVDELGATPLDSKDYKKNFFNELLRSRSDKKLGTILTSNLSPKVFGDRNGRRLWSFIKEEFVFLEFVSDIDHRELMQDKVVNKLGRFLKK